MKSEPEKEYDGTVVWRLPNGDWHREDGPAILYPDGRESWYMNDLPHRIGGPAIVSEEGAKQWFINGQLHRTDGPAYEFASGAKLYFINDIGITLEKFKEQYLMIHLMEYDEDA